MILELQDDQEQYQDKQKMNSASLNIP